MTDPGVHYKIRFPAPQTHYMEVEARFRDHGASEVELFLPVWTPGSYLIREYSRHLEALRAVTGDGRPLVITKTQKNRWRIQADQPIGELIISYSLYCHELSVRTNWVDENYALIVGAATFLCPINAVSAAFKVTVELPADWGGPWSGMKADSSAFFAPDYDALIDSPIAAGYANTFTFDLNQHSHTLVTVGDHFLWDLRQAAKDVALICQEHTAFWGEIPYDNYVFLNLVTRSRGALEHRNSMVLMADRFSMRSPGAYLNWLQLVSHEFFHVWNVKGLRPQGLGPFDYEHEVYTTNLWIAEGLTEYYGLLGVRRAELCTDQEFLSGGTSPGQPHPADSLSGLIGRLQNTPGRLAQPLALSSFDAWIKLYRPDENTINSAISYYVKGAVLGWLLDATIRSASNGLRSLDDVMRVAWQRHGGKEAYDLNDFLLIIEEVSDPDIKHWMEHVLDSTDELDYASALDWFGLRFEPATTTGSKVWLGVNTRVDGGRLVVSEVLRDSPAWDAGLSPADEIIGVQGYRLRPEQWLQRLEYYRPGEQVVLTVARGERLTQVEVRLAAEPVNSWRLEIDPSAPPDRQQNLRMWLSSVH